MRSDDDHELLPILNDGGPLAIPRARNRQVWSVTYLLFIPQRVHPVRPEDLPQRDRPDACERMGRRHVHEVEAGLVDDHDSQGRQQQVGIEKRRFPALQVVISRELRRRRSTCARFDSVITTVHVSRSACSGLLCTIGKSIPKRSGSARRPGSGY